MSAQTTDVLLLCGATACLAMVLLTVVNSSCRGWDERLLMWFSEAASTPGWSVNWWFFTVAWLAVRFVLFEHFEWFRVWGDNLLITLLFATSPYMVENAMKFSTKRSMDVLERQNQEIARQNQQIIEQTQTLADLTTAVREQLDRADDHDELLHAMVARLLDALERNHAVDDLVVAIRSHLAMAVVEVDAQLRDLVGRLIDELDKGA